MAEVDASTNAPRALPAVQVVLTIFSMGLAFAALLFLPAGRLDWTLGWIYLGIVITFVVINWVCLSRWNPELIRRRMRYGKGTKQWDKVWTFLFAPVMIAVYVVAGLGVRWNAGGLPMLVWPLGLAIFCLGSIVLVWSMVVNPFFEKTVRIQTEQGHRVIESGPYAWVRHPGYVGFTSWMLATPLLLGSAWALIPASLSVLAIVIRTSLEDRTLRAELSGYAGYAKRVRFRLVPGLW